jgi:osmotically-inducible protein OsmY
MLNNKIIIIGITSTLLSCSLLADNNVKDQKQIDIDIANSVRSLFEADPIINSGNIEISSVNQNLKLKGITSSKAQYDEAVAVANSLAGIKSIDASSLKIKKSKNYLNDAYITGKIKGKLITDKVVLVNQPNPFYINVETVNGNVYLTGVVEDTKQAVKAISTSYDTKGVSSVTSYLTVYKNDFAQVI